jgi:hypothetical protein
VSIHPDDEPRQLPTRTVDAAKLYWSNVHHLDQPEVAAFHAKLAETAALVAIAESLDTIAKAITNPVDRQRDTATARNVDLLTKTLKQIEVHMR